MLKINKNTTISATIDIEGVSVMSLSATIEEGSNSGAYVNRNCVNTELYEQHKESVRQQIEEFTNYVYELEDRK